MANFEQGGRCSQGVALAWDPLREDGGLAKRPELALRQAEAEAEAEAKGEKSQLMHVGLLNQGMTCYLNSLLQTLFMTPEFRTSLFQWRYSEEKQGDAVYCIPYQLQCLFARLMLSERGAVGTTHLTKSFRWEGKYAFQQHDVQELLMKLFNVLDSILAPDPNNSFLSHIYNGQYKDYLQCQTCSYKREQKCSFLSLICVVKGMRSLDHSLRKYIQQEQLCGDWRCSGCRKVDALKGFEITHLPTILMISLKVSTLLSLSICLSLVLLLALRLRCTATATTVYGLTRTLIYIAAVCIRLQITAKSESAR